MKWLSKVERWFYNNHSEPFLAVVVYVSLIAGVIHTIVIELLR